MKLICIGVGGTGAACLESLVHLAALGLLPKNTELIPVMVDPDQQHPRVQGTSRFIADYNKIRRDGTAATLVTDGLFGTQISQVVKTNALRPTQCENLFSLLGLHQGSARPLAKLFFADTELGKPKSREFANGYYGRVNAGVCFFNDPKGRDDLLSALRNLLLGGDANLLIVGSAFGGTGAAGLIHLARILREDNDLRNAEFTIGAVQLEPYFEPDRPTNVGGHDFVNLPDTFESRTGAAYQFLAALAEYGNLPFDVLYPLGVPTPTTFPPEWFKRDQQDNPHLYLEYLAALAVRDFALNCGHSDIKGKARLRRTAVTPFGGPLELFSSLMYKTAVTRRLIETYLLPLLDRVDALPRLPGHVWVSAVCGQAELSADQLAGHLKQTRDLLDDILVAAGLDRELAISRHGKGEKMAAVGARKNERTRASFPPGMMPDMSNLNVVQLVASGDPDELLMDYDRNGDARLPVRSLFRWVDSSLKLPELPRDPTPPRHQWTQQADDDAIASGQPPLNINIPNDDEFKSEPIALVLSQLALAPWRRPTERSAAEYPSMWAPALVHRDSLYDVDAADYLRHLHLGLLAVALLKRNKQVSVPVRLLEAPSASQAFQDSVKSTFPLGDPALIAPSGVLALFERPDPLAPDGLPSEDEVVGFLYPDTVVVPAAGMTPANRNKLIQLGRHTAGRGFPQTLLTWISNEDWSNVLAASGIPGSSDRGFQFVTFLRSFGGSLIGPPFTNDDRFTGFPIPEAADWVHALYRQGDHSGRST